MIVSVTELFGANVTGFLYSADGFVLLVGGLDLVNQCR